METEDVRDLVYGITEKLGHKDWKLIIEPCSEGGWFLRFTIKDATESSGGLISHTRAQIREDVDPFTDMLEKAVTHLKSCADGRSRV